jgi:hypothetical protein
MPQKLLHLFTAQSAVSLSAPDGSKAKEGEPKLTWKVVLRTGTWALRPGPGGTKLDEPLKIFRGKAPKGHISLEALVKNFEGDEKGPAKEHVTFPTVHADGTVTDSGFVRKLVIQDVYGEDGSQIKESLLWAGIEITDSVMATKVAEKSIVGCSGGILFDYKRTEDGKKFDQVLSHVMATNSPWINGCGGYSDKLPEGVMAAEDAPDEEDEVSLDAPLIDDGGVAPPSGMPAPKPAEGTVVWRPEEGFSFMKSKVQRALDSWRRSVIAAIPEDKRSYDDFPHMRCEDVSHDGTRGKAMIRSGYGDDAAVWIANFKLDDDKDAIIEPFQDWTEAAQEWVAASEEQGRPKPARPAPPSGRPAVELTDLRRAQMAREKRSYSATDTTPTSNGGPPMSKLSELLASGIELSDEQRALADAALAEERAAEERARRDAEARREADAKAYLSELDGLGLGEKDTPGLRAEVRNIILSDDGGPALMLSEVTDSGQRTQPIQQTATEIVKRVINALPRNQEGKIALSAQARFIPGDEKPAVGSSPDGEEEDKLTPAQKADALLAANGFEIGVPITTGGN